MAQKSSKMVIFGINLPPKGPLKQFLQNFAWGGSPGPHLHAKFHHCSLKMWPYGPKIAKNGNFW